MTSDRKTLSSDELRALLETLDRVMADAQHLRRQVTQQLSDGRKREQQTLSPASHRRTTRGSATTEDRHAARSETRREDRSTR